MSALPPIADILGIGGSKKKGTGTMAGPPTRSSLSLAFRNNWRRRGFALAVWIASVLRIARSDAEESQRRCSQ